MSPPAGAAPADSTPTIVAGGDSLSHFRDAITLLAGSPRTLVYAEQEVRSPQSVLGAYSPIYTIFARDKDGATRELGTMVNLDQFYDRWSLSGNTLAVGEWQDRRVRWWNVKTGAGGELSLPGGFLTAAPGGVSFLSQHDVVRVKTVDGMVTGWRAPLHGWPVWSAYAGDHAMVMGSEFGPLRYVRFDRPNHVRKLPVGNARHPRCHSMSHKYLGCELRKGVTALVPTNGSAPIFHRDKTGHDGPPTALAGSKTFIWVHSGKDSRHHVLGSRKARSRRVIRGTQRISWGNLVTAYREAITLTPTRHKILAAASATQIQTLSTAPLSPVEVRNFVLTSDRILDIDDADSSPPDGGETLRSRAITDNGGTISVGAPTNLYTDGARQLDGVVADGSSYAYSTSRDGLDEDGRIVYDGHSIGVPKGADGPWVLSGHWFGYVQDHAENQDLMVLDLNTGISKMYLRAESHTFDDSQFAIADDKLDYFDENRRILQADLNTGDVTQLAPASTDAPYSGTRVYAAGGRVGWDVEDPESTVDPIASVVRNADGSTISLSEPLIGLSSAGALLSTIEPDYAVDAATYDVQPTTVTLRRWDGTTTDVLPPAVYGEPPQLAGDRLAWITEDGTLMIKSLS